MTTEDATLSTEWAEADAPPVEVQQAVYDELRRIAYARLRHEQHVSLAATDLVHEAFLRLTDAPRVAARGRAYFFAAAAQAMRRVLVDAARRRARVRHGAGVAPVRLDSLAVSALVADDDAASDAVAASLLDLDDALGALERRSPRAARVVECRYFAGLSVEETARALDVSPRTVKGDWALARAWLALALADGAPAAAPLAPAEALPRR